MSPKKVAKFGLVFLLGIFLITTSFSFLPMLVVSPQKFALSFTFGSTTLMSSFAVLKGPKAMLKSMFSSSKLPVTALYIAGLIGTVVATIVMRNFVLTAVFGLTQA